MINLMSLPFLIDAVSKNNSIIDDNGGYLLIEGLGDKLRGHTKNIFADAKVGLQRENETVISRVVEFESILLSEVKNNNFLNNILHDHLGNFNLDISYSFSTNYGRISHRNSQLWHHDSVGRRLKLFLVNEMDSSPSLLLEAQRGGSFLSPNMPLSDRCSYEPSANVVTFAMDPAHGYLIDTGYMHSGKAMGNGEQRIALVTEFSNRFKSFCRGRVGRRLVP